MNEKLSRHFGFNELTVTEVREFVSENRDVPQEVYTNLVLLCGDVLEPVRALFGIPLIVHSGYRCLALNTHIGGAKTSEHMDGNAADFHILGMDTEAGIQHCFDVIRKTGLAWGQLIQERGIWIHVSRATVKHSHEILTFDGKKYTRLEA